MPTERAQRYFSEMRKSGAGATMQGTEPQIPPAIGEQEAAGPEPFVDDIVAARFLSVTPRRTKEMARNGEIPAHPLGTGQRKT